MTIRYNPGGPGKGIPNISEPSRSSQLAAGHNEPRESTSGGASFTGIPSRSRCLWATEKKWYTTAKRASPGGPGQGFSSGISDEGLTATPEEAKKAGVGRFPKAE